MSFDRYEWQKTPWGYINTANPVPVIHPDRQLRDEFDVWAMSVGYQRDELRRCKIGVVSPEYFSINTESAFKAYKAGKQARK